MTATDLKPGKLATVQGDKRHEENTQVVVLNIDSYPLVQVRLGTNQYDTKSKAFFINASKLVI